MFAGWITFSAEREETKTTCVDTKRQWRHASR